MLKKQPLSPTDVRDSKVYRDWGLTDAEYQLLTDKVLQRLPCLLFSSDAADDQLCVESGGRRSS